MHVGFGYVSDVGQVEYCYTAAGVFRSERMQRQLLQHTVNAYLMQIAYQCVHILQCVCISYICMYVQTILVCLIIVQ